MLSPLIAQPNSALLFCFEANQGQVPADVRYLTHGGNRAVYFMNDRAVFQTERRGGPVQWKRETEASSFQMIFRHGRKADAPEPAEPSETTVNYLTGRDPAQWHVGVPTFHRLVYRALYPGIDLTYYGNAGHLEYDFVVQPGANPAAIELEFGGARSLQLTPGGELAIDAGVSDGGLVSRKPVVYQEVNGKRRTIAGVYRLAGNHVTFRIGRYDRKLPLIIDPVLVYAGYLGGSDFDLATDLRADASGMYAVGTSYSANFPTTSGAWNQTATGAADIVVAKLNPAGTGLLYATYIGGSDTDVPNASAVGADGSLYLTGFTSSTDFPVTTGAWSGTYAGGLSDAFVLKLSPDGKALTYSTYMGGSGGDIATGLFVDGTGKAYVSGITDSGDYPATTGVVQPTYGGGTADAFVFKLDATGGNLLYATYLGGSGSEGFLNATGASIPSRLQQVYGTSVWVDAYGSAYVGGATNSANFPVTQGAYSTASGGGAAEGGGAADGWVVRLSANASAILFGTFIGGTGFDAVTGLHADLAGNMVVAGVTSSTNFPVTQDALYATYRGGYSDAYLAVFSPMLDKLIYSTYFGGLGEDAGARVDVANTGKILLSGWTGSTDLPVTIGTYQTAAGGQNDMFVALFSAARTQLLDCTYFGTPGTEYGGARFGTGPNDILLAGWSDSTALATSTGAYQAAFGGGGSDMVLARMGLPVATAEPVPQTISFSYLPNVTLGSGPQALTATADSGLTVTFASTTPGVCTVSGTTVTLVAAGGCSITANQAGNSNWAAAPAVTQKFTVLFTDVLPTDFYATAATLMAQYGITSGCGGNGFCPNANVTRAQMAIFMVRAIEGGDNFTYSATPYFSDVRSTDFGFRWIQKMKELGITNGCSTGLYCPNDNVTRAQMAIFIIRARFGVGLAGPVPGFSYAATPSFSDVPAGSFGFAWIQRMKRDSVTAGCTASNYCPNDPVTRGQMAIFVLRAAFNQLLPSGTPVLSAVVPSTLAAGTTATVTITGTNTNFVQDVTVLSPLPGITMGPVTVISPTALTVELTAAANATAQPYSLLAITGGEEAALPNGLVVQ